jgi:PAS domain S-box-containing protein
MANPIEPTASKPLRERFRLMVDGVQDGISIIESGKVLGTNDRLGEMFGYSRTELSRMSDLALAAPEEVARLRRAMQETREQGLPPEELEFWAVRKDGSRRYVRSRYCRWPDRDGVPRFLVLTSDITERKAAPQQPAEQELFLRRILDVSPNLVFVKDRECRFVLVNQRYAQAFRLRPEDFVGQDEMGMGWPEDLVMGNPKLDIPGVWTSDRQVIQSGRTTHIAGEWLWVGTQRRLMTTTRVPLRNGRGDVWGLVGFASGAVEPEPLAPRTGTLYRVSEALAAASGPEEILHAVAESSVETGAHVATLMYVNVDAGGRPEWAETMAAFGGTTAPLGRRFYLPESPQASLFFADPSRPVMASDLTVTRDGMNQDVVRIMKAVHAQAFVSIPLVTGDRWQGLVTIAWPAPHEFSPEEEELYGQIGPRLAARIQGQRLREDAEHRVVWSQTAAEVSHAAASVLDPDELLERVVNLVHDRFGLYYVGLFLVGQEPGEREPGKWAFLRVGTGKAGQQMVEQGHKLEVGSVSMIGQCLATKQPRIAMDVGKEAVYFANPLLPDTRTELALPLISRGQALGALSIQSTQAAAFSAEEMAVLQTMADQLAIAIDNAGMIQRAQSRAEWERRVRDITERIHRSADAGIIMRVAVEELSQMLGASRAIIRLGTQEQLLAESGQAPHSEG